MDDEDDLTLRSLFRTLPEDEARLAHLLAEVAPDASLTSQKPRLRAIRGAKPRQKRPVRTGAKTGERRLMVLRQDDAG